MEEKAVNSKKLDSAIIDDILNKMIETVQSSKDQIFEIGEKSRTEYEKIVEELEEVKEQVSEVIKQTDKLTIQSKIARQRLVEVSRNFTSFQNKIF